MSMPYALAGWLSRQFTDGDGVPLAGGFVETRVAGSATLKTTYADSDTVSPTPNANPIPLDADGRATIFLEAGAYDFEVQNSLSVALYTVEGVEDVGLTFLSQWGVELNEGARDVVSGYTVLATDNTITVDSTGGADPCVINLPAVADRGLELTIINLGTVALAITPNGSETINLVAAAFEVDASSSPVLSTINLRPDPSSNWWALTGTVTGSGGSGGTGTVTHTAGALTASALIVGNGAADLKALASLGTTTTVLHGDAAGLPTFSAVATGDIAANAVTNAKLATMATGTIKANITGGTAVPTDVTYAAFATAANFLTIPFSADTEIDFGTAIFKGKSVTPPGAPAATYGVLYFDTSGGKVRLVARFPTGAVQIIAVEP